MKKTALLVWGFALCCSLWAGKQNGDRELFRLQPDLRLNANAGEEYFWAGVDLGLQVDGRGHMYVVEGAEARILEYDASGKLVRTIGRPGQGPGEYEALRSWQILGDGSAVGFENLGAVTRVTWYDEKFEYKDKETITGIGMTPRYAQFSPDARWIGSTTTIVDQEKDVEITKFVIFDRQFKPVKELLHWETTRIDPSRLQEPAMWRDFLAERFGVMAKGHNHFITFDKDGNVYTAPAHTYKITKWDPNLKKITTFGREYEPIPLGEKELDAVIDPIREGILSHLPQELEPIISRNLIQQSVALAEFPPVKFPVSGLLSMGDRIVVVHAQNALDRTGRGDVFSNKGDYLGYFLTQNSALSNMVFQGDYAYGLESNEEDEISLVRYKIVPISGS